MQNIFLGLGSSALVSLKLRWRKGRQDESALEDLRTLFDCGADFMEHAQAEDAIESLTEYINEVYSLVEPPLETVVRAEDKLSNIYLLLQLDIH